MTGFNAVVTKLYEIRNLLAACEDVEAKEALRILIDLITPRDHPLRVQLIEAEFDTRGFTAENKARVFPNGHPAVQAAYSGRRERVQLRIDVCIAWATQLRDMSVVLGGA